ncbi:MAG: hypothetical protein FIA82_07605 [Melioribacter sp.]|nr:hypothetical protein [Melioribacter sp.]
MKKKDTRPENSKKHPFYFYIILILIPIILLFFLEAGLQLFNYGYSTDQWVEITNNKLILNPEIAYRYFHKTSGIPYPTRDSFDKIKSSNSIRVFVLGESSTAGFPYSPNGTFSKYIKKRLLLNYPDRNIEVVNLSMAAINSYSLLDLMPGIIDQKPDLIIIYAGHNEYYGALGVASSESLGNSRILVKLMLYLNRFKTVQLIRNFIDSITSLFKSDIPQAGTLMQRMVKDQLIPINSEMYYDGINQFQNNLDEIFKMISASKIPVVIGTLTSNLKDQKPFISSPAKNYPEADVVFNNAEKMLSEKKINEADSLFEYAKELDLLRFRAPKKINFIIKELGKKYNYTVVDFDSIFKALSPDGIVGDNLMSDHLHPTLFGYKSMGKIFYEEVMKKNIFPTPKGLLSNEEQDKYVFNNYSFTRIDSTIAQFRLFILKNSWPYNLEQQNINLLYEKIPRKDITDSLAFLVIKDELSWELAHRKLAERYLQESKIDGFVKEMDAVIDQFPDEIAYYKITAGNLVETSNFDLAESYLKKYYEIIPDAFCTKWLGIINLNKKKIKDAIFYLQKSLEFNSSDPQTFYNIAGAFALDGNYKNGLEYISQCLKIDPGFDGAINLKTELQNILAGKNN